MKPECCLDCEHHEVILDKDPDDWFCDDDMAVVCKKVPNDTQNLESKWMSDHSSFKVVEPSIRPYNLRKESKSPEWCPLKGV